MASQDGDAAWQDPRWALGHYAASVAPGAALRRERTGLLNDTYAVGAGPDFTLQLVEVQFGDDVIERIAAVAPLLAAGGITPPQLVRTDDGALSLPVPDGRRWRLFDWIAGEVHDRPPTPAHARSAGALLARFHDLIRDDASCRAFPDSGFHDTARRMRRLASVIAGSDADAEIRGLADQVLALWADWRRRAPADVPLRPGHGDPKFSNFVFRPGSAEPAGIIDFDTLGLYRLDDDLGDAIRSWCNLAGFDDPAARFDEATFAATVEGYLGASRSISAAERRRIVHGGVRITLELASRFCADAVEQSYFHWKPELAPDARTHNVWRTQAQLDLARQMIARRDRLEAIVAAAG